MPLPDRFESGADPRDHGPLSFEESDD